MERWCNTCQNPMNRCACGPDIGDDEIQAALPRGSRIFRKEMIKAKQENSALRSEVEQLRGELERIVTDEYKSQAAQYRRDELDGWMERAEKAEAEVERRNEITDAIYHELTPNPGDCCGDFNVVEKVRGLVQRAERLERALRELVEVLDTPGFDCFPEIDARIDNAKQALRGEK